MLGERLKQLREEKQVLQKDVASYLNITTSAYGFYEQNKRTPDAEALQQLSDYYNVSTDFLLGKTNIRNTYEAAEKISDALSDDSDLVEFWNTLKKRDDLKLLFKQTKDLSPKAIQQIIRIIKAIEDEESNNN